MKTDERGDLVIIESHGLARAAADEQNQIHFI